MRLPWSDWVPLDRDLTAAGPGLYRLRVADAGTLAYIGETGSLATRLRSHIARLRHVGVLSVSVAPVDPRMGKTGRLEWENDPIAHHLLSSGQAPTAQFGAGPGLGQLLPAPPDIPTASARLPHA